MVNLRSVILAGAAIVAGCGAEVGPREPSAPQATPPGNAEPTPAELAPPAERGTRLYARPSSLMPTSVTSFGAAASESYVYVLGGYFGMPHAYSSEGQSQKFSRMHVGTKVWEELPSVGGIQSVTLTAFRGKLYRSGGMRVKNAPGEPKNLVSVAEFARFDPARKVWEDLPPLPQPRSSHAAALVGSKLYVVGGWQLDGPSDSGVFDKTMAVVDLAHEPLGWTSLPFPAERRAVAAAAFGQQLVVVGGLSPNMNMSGATHLFDTTTNTWSQGPELTDEAFGVASFQLDGAVHASGSSGKVFRLSSDLTRWSDVGSLTFPRFFHQYVELEDHTALALGGIGDGSRIRHIEQLSSRTPAGRVTSFELESPGRAKNRQGIFIHGAELYLFGGNSSLGQHDFAPENFLTEAFELDIGSLEFRPSTAFPANRQSMQTIVSGDVGYALGGFGPNGDQLTTHAEVYRFDFEKQSWQKARQGLAESRTQFGVAEHGGALWIFGGLNFSDARQGEAQFSHVDSVLTHDLKQPESGFVASGVVLPRKRRAFSAALLNGKYYMVGGMAAGFELVDEIDVFDLEAKVWSTIAKPRRTRIGAEMVALNQKLYLVAGRAKGPDGKLGEDPSIEVYDPRTDRWSVLVDELPMRDTHQLRVFPFHDRLLVYSAQRDDGKLQVLFVDPT